MNKNISKRVKEEATYMIKTKKTIREIAESFNISKSTIHKDLQERLLSISPTLHKEVKKILAEHLKIRHIKGGNTTKQKYFTKQAS